MKLHLVGGFLGSGKTTAIIAAARVLMARGLKVGVITNDQGRYLVDTAFFRADSLPAVEVTGGCFCCNYDDLNQRLIQLLNHIRPDVVFAESVGSCADIVATVVKPLFKSGDDRIRPSSFSVFVDSRLLLRWLGRVALPFSADVVYIFEKQLEEAGLLVVNKMDLLSDGQAEELRRWVGSHFQDLPVHYQNSLRKGSVLQWVDQIQAMTFSPNLASLEIDYETYARGELQMAWLDQYLHLYAVDGDPDRMVKCVLEQVVEGLVTNQIGIGHLKVMVKSGDQTAKISFTSLEAGDWVSELPPFPESDVDLLINARVETTAENLLKLVQNALGFAQEQIHFSYQQLSLEAFHPGKPQPTHRIQK
jgi:Ni2+-binding GTPase involved in maturation of urease and hydrogenase